jgi:translation initiation factor IF-3
MFRGREVTHPERGQMILDRLAEELGELAVIEQRPNLDGRNMTMLLGPSKAVLSGTLAKAGETNGAGAPEASEDGAATEAVEDGAPEAVEAAASEAVEDDAAEAVEDDTPEAAADEPESPAA